MSIVNMEIKAQCDNPDRIRQLLKENNARFVGTDHQVDTYFNVVNGRLKLREGEIENALIYYNRENKSGPKTSNVKLYKPGPDATLKSLLEESLGVLTVVDKIREIYFIDNVKFHIDKVNELGSFVEIEAIDKDGVLGKEKLLKQCNFYLGLFGISENELVAGSYSDMILNKTNSGY